jgi:hypothetical protein
VTTGEGRVFVFIGVDHCTSECIGIRSRIIPVMVFEIGNRSAPTRRSPPLWTEWDSWASNRYLFVSGDRPPGDVHLVPGEADEGRLGEVEVLGREALGGVADPVGDAERAELGEVAIVEDQDKVARLVTEALEHVAVAAGEVPDVARLELVRLGVALRVEDRSADVALDDERPLGGGGMPVQFTRCPRLEHHRDTGDPPGDRQLLDCRLLAVAVADDLLPSDFSIPNLKVGGSSLSRIGSGTLFMRLGSPASPDFGRISAAVVTAASPAAAKNSRLGPPSRSGSLGPHGRRVPPERLSPGPGSIRPEVELGRICGPSLDAGGGGDGSSESWSP